MARKNSEDEPSKRDWKNYSDHSRKEWPVTSADKSSKVELKELKRSHWWFFLTFITLYREEVILQEIKRGREESKEKCTTTRHERA